MLSIPAVRAQNHEAAAVSLSVHEQQIAWEDFVSPSNCRRKRLVDSNGAARVVRGDLRVALLEIETGDTCRFQPRDFARIGYALRGSLTLAMQDHSVALAPGSVFRVPPGVAYRVSEAGAGTAQWILYEWAPMGDLDSLHQGSTMVEEVAIDDRVRPRPDILLKRYEPRVRPEVSERFWASEAAIVWTTNWSYSDKLWSVYRYKPLVREPLEDWDGVAQDDVRMGLQELEPGASYPAHHHASPEVYFVVQGEARWNVGGEAIAAPVGTLVYTPPHAIHRVNNSGSEPLRWLYLWWAPSGDRARFRDVPSR